MMGHGNSLRGPPLLSTLSIDNRIDTYPVKATSQAVMSYTTIQMIQVQVRSGRCRIYSRNCLQYIHIIQLFSSASILPLRLVLRRCQSARGDANHNKKKWMLVNEHGIEQNSKVKRRSCSQHSSDQQDPSPSRGPAGSRASPQRASHGDTARVVLDGCGEVHTFP